MLKKQAALLLALFGQWVQSRMVKLYSMIGIESRRGSIFIRIVVETSDVTPGGNRTNALIRAVAIAANSDTIVAFLNGWYGRKFGGKINFC